MTWNTGAVFISRFRTAIDQKLGRCVTCIRTSVTLTFCFLAILTFLIVGRASAVILLSAAAPAIAFTTLSVAHGVAYAVREPPPSTGCTPCAAKARARQRALRRKNLVSWFRKSQGSIRVHQRAAAKSKPKSLDDLALSADELPKADVGLLAVIKSSAEFGMVAPRLSQTEPVDSWRVDKQNHFLFELKPEDGGTAPNALFVARWEDYDLLSAIVITPDSNGGEARIVDLRAPETSRSISLG